MGFALEEVRKNVFTTDQRSNMLSALEDCKRLNCSAHLTATVLRNVFDFHNEKSKSFLYLNCPNSYLLITACRSIVTYIKRSGKHLELAKTVKMMAEPRWNTLLDMLQSVCDVFPQIMELLAEQGESARLEHWDADIATQLVKFLTPIRSVSVELQAKKHPTLHLVLIRYYDLLEHCQVQDDDDPEIVTIKQKAEELLKDKFLLDDLHYAAALLCPNTRTLKRLDTAGKERARALVLASLKKIQEDDATEAPVGNAPPPKKSRFGEWSEDEKDNAMSPEDEVELYLKFGKSSSDHPAQLLLWWKDKATTFPRLAKLARRVLSILATSSSSERTWSRAGLILTEKRTNLSPQKVCDLLVIHNYFLSTKAATTHGRMVAEIDVDPAGGDSSEGSDLFEPEAEDSDSSHE